MTTATENFSEAIQVRRSSDGIYEFASTKSKSFASVISECPFSDPPTEFDWSVVERLTGWGDWTHVAKVTYGDRDVYYFAR